ncbi:MAG TPA: DMT family transporter [Thermoanaerobaculia bacterium]|nr:DMT family transporter [Thermoanaerobaculia bacterium]
MRKSARRPLALAGALLSILIWSVNYPAMKVAFREMSPLAFTWWRFALATTVLVAEARLRREPILPPPEGRRLALVLALSGVGVYQWLYALGLAATTSFSAAVLNSVSPLVAMLLVAILGWERPSFFTAFGSLVAWSGVALFVGAARGSGLGSLPGNLMCLGAAACWGTFNVASSRLAGRMSPMTAQAFTFAGGGALVLVYAFPAMLRQDYRAVGAGTWVILVLSSILPLVLAFRLWPEAIRTLGVAQATSLGFLTPVVAGVASALWTGERFDAGKLLAAGVVLAGLALTRVRRGTVPPRAARA